MEIFQDEYGKDAHRAEIFKMNMEGMPGGGNFQDEYGKAARLRILQAWSYSRRLFDCGMYFDLHINLKSTLQHIYYYRDSVPQNCHCYISIWGWKWFKIWKNTFCSLIGKNSSQSGTTLFVGGGCT